jgi:putative ribonuclease E
MIRAGLGLSGTPLTCPPDAQVMESMMSVPAPPHRPMARTGTIAAPGATPATPIRLFALAAMMPATWVPCQEELVASDPW